MSSLKAVTSLDGRYALKTEQFSDIFSEFALIRHRVCVEIEWLKFIYGKFGVRRLSANEIKSIDSIFTGFNEESAMMVKNIEKTTNHDVKAVEYYIKSELVNRNLGDIQEWVHFSCTSEDINNTSYALMIKKGKNIVVKEAKELLDVVESMGKEWKSVPMMSRTHGQPASPTTVGKEFIVFASRLKFEIGFLESLITEGKMNGATGNFNAHSFVFPDVDWIDLSSEFISAHLGIKPLIWSTQINHYGYISAILHSMIRLSAIMTDIDKDFWGYISFGYFKQKTKAGEVGSSTMPHKVNPIDFENSEGNFGLGIALMEHLAVKLLNSRFQRDLTDSTALRNLGSCFAYFSMGISSLLKGLSKLEIHAETMLADLKANPELLAEPIQTIMRFYGEENPYEKLKALTRGKRMSLDELSAFIDTLEKVPEDAKKRMKKLTPESYVGIAEELVDRYFDL